MIFWRDVAPLGAAAVAAVGLAVLSIRANHQPPSEPLGYLRGTVLSYAVQVSEAGGTRGFLDLRLDGGEQLRVPAAGLLVPGNRACVRAGKRGNRIEGHLVPPDRCGEP